jgi:hypothetical protein
MVYEEYHFKENAKTDPTDRDFALPEDMKVGEWG